MQTAPRAPNFPPGALVRVKDICGDPLRGVRGVLPIHPATWYSWVKAGRVPPGRRLGPRTVAWPIEQVLAIGECREAA